MRYSIEEKTLTDMADAVRTKVMPGELVVQDTTMASDSGHVVYIDLSKMAGNRFRITIKDVEFFGSAWNFILHIYNTSGTDVGGYWTNSVKFPVVFEEYLDKTKGVTFTTSGGDGVNFTYIVEAIDDEGKPHTLTPQEMIDKLNAVAPGPLDEELIVTGDCEYRFSYDGWTWFIEKYGDRITTKDITSSSNMFEYSGNLTNIPFDLNYKTSSSHNISYIFRTCSKLKAVPKMSNVKPSQMENMFYACRELREIPDDFTSTWDWSNIDNATSAYRANTSSLFQHCNSLRKFPVDLISHINSKATGSSYLIYYNGFGECSVLDEINNLVVHKGKITSNAFSGTISNCYRLKNFTFAPYDGTVEWSKQTIDVGSGSSIVGYGNYIPSITTSYNSGITADKEVKDDATYQALKDDPDWFTTKIEYSRYNHDSAVNTINSLPTTTGTGCTIKFKGASGSLTDGGAINTLTEEEIAVAAAKGWTITLT